MKPGEKNCKQWPCRESLGAAAHRAVLNLLLLEQLWKWTKAPSRALLDSDLLQRQIKGASFSVKIYVSQGFRHDFRQGIACCWFQSRTGLWLGRCSDDSSVRNCWRWYSNISVTHGCITDLLPFAGVFLLLCAKNCIVGKVWASLVSFFTLRSEFWLLFAHSGVLTSFPFWCGDWHQWNATIMGSVWGEQGGDWWSEKVLGEFTMCCWVCFCFFFFLFLDKPCPVSCPFSLQTSWGKVYPECWSLLLLDWAHVGLRSSWDRKQRCFTKWEVLCTHNPGWIKQFWVPKSHVNFSFDSLAEGVRCPCVNWSTF